MLLPCDRDRARWLEEGGIAMARAESVCPQERMARSQPHIGAVGRGGPPAPVRVFGGGPAQARRTRRGRDGHRDAPTRTNPNVSSGGILSMAAAAEPLSSSHHTPRTWSLIARRRCSHRCWPGDRSVTSSDADVHRRGRAHTERRTLRSIPPTRAENFRVRCFFRPTVAAAGAPLLT